METKIAGKECGKLIKRNRGFSRAVVSMDCYAPETLKIALPKMGGETDAHDAERLALDRWQPDISQTVRHNTFR